MRLMDILSESRPATALEFAKWVLERALERGFRAELIPSSWYSHDERGFLNARDGHQKAGIVQFIDPTTRRTYKFYGAPHHLVVRENGKKIVEFYTERGRIADRLNRDGEVIDEPDRRVVGDVLPKVIQILDRIQKRGQRNLSGGGGRVTLRDIIDAGFEPARLARALGIDLSMAQVIISRLDPANIEATAFRVYAQALEEHTGGRLIKDTVLDAAGGHVGAILVSDHAKYPRYLMLRTYYRQQHSRLVVGLRAFGRSSLEQLPGLRTAKAPKTTKVADVLALADALLSE
jgi:hypothetical protein